MSDSRTLPPPVGLSALRDIPLSAENHRFLDEGAALAGGSPAWRARKRAEVRDLLALSQIAPRLVVQDFRMFEALQVILLLRVPVPCLDENRQFQLGSHAMIGLTYSQEAL